LSWMVQIPSFSAGIEVHFLFFLFLLHFNIVYDRFDVVPELSHGIVNTGGNFVLCLEFETAFTMCALVFTQVSFFCVQINLWACFTHNSLNVVWIFFRNFIANRFDSLIRCNLKIWIEWTVTLTSASTLPVAISLSPTV